jgi:hypothetical protein
MLEILDLFVLHLMEPSNSLILSILMNNGAQAILQDKKVSTLT